MNAIKHALQNPFISSTGLAAFVHSTWALATLFGGLPPKMALSLEFIYWLVPAMLIAFALDVGQIATSGQIRGGQRSGVKYATFTIFAVANYFLQWLYMAHHMPQLALANGVRAEWQAIAELIRDASLWIIPAFLPLSTLLYTLSEDEQETRVIEIKPVVADLPELPSLPEPSQIAAKSEFGVVQDLGNGSFATQCQDCEWQGTYETALQARQAHNAHARRCPNRVVFSGNGHGHKEGV